MLIFMFFSSFSYNFACYIGETTFFATKVLLFSHIRKRETYFFNKKSYFPSFSSPISLSFGQISPAFTPYTLHHPYSPHKMTRIIHFFASKLAYINQKHYFCNGKAIFLLTKMMWIILGTMEHKSCPRCDAAFICQHENPAKCQCAGVELSPAIRAHLAAQYPNQCLCRKCLIELGTSN